MNTIENTLKSTTGRFFTLMTKNSLTINAQLRRLTPKTALVFDRNSKINRRFMLSNIAGVQCGSASAVN